MIDFTTWTQRNSKRGLVPGTTSDRNKPFGQEAYEEMVRTGYEMLAAEAKEEADAWFDDVVDDVEEVVEDVVEFFTGSKQEGGDHYQMAIGPIDYILANDLGYCEGNVIKYVSRHDRKNGKEDILKAMHYLEFILEDQYGDEE